VTIAPRASVPSYKRPTSLTVTGNALRFVTLMQNVSRGSIPPTGMACAGTTLSLIRVLSRLCQVLMTPSTAPTTPSTAPKIAMASVIA
jgi:hypothetical protein